MEDTFKGDVTVKLVGKVWSVTFVQPIAKFPTATVMVDVLTVPASACPDLRVKTVKLPIAWTLIARLMGLALMASVGVKWAGRESIALKLIIG